MCAKKNKQRKEMAQAHRRRGFGDDLFYRMVEHHAVNVGDEIEFHFKYSARPAKLRKDILPACSVGWVLKSGSCIREECEGPECTVSSPIYEGKPAEIEEDYIIYHLPQRTEEVTETTLPGLEEGSKIKIDIWQPTLMSKEIETYELIS